MKNSKFKKFALTSVFLTFLVLATCSLVNNAKASEPTEPHLANALWTEPSSMSINNYTAHIGDKFNVTVWVNVTESSFTWQTTLLFNTTYFNATRTAYTAVITSDFFTGHMAMTGTPVIDNVVGSVLTGETLLGTDFREPGHGSLIWVEFALKEIPPQNHLTVNFSIPYDVDTYVLNPDLDTIPMETINGTDIPVIPEFPQLIMLLIATVTSTASVILTKKFKR